jgi:DNA repair protein RadC
MQHREKLQAKVSGNLANLELFCVLVDSDNAQRSTAKITSGVLEVLQNKRADVKYEDIKNINGLGSTSE